MVICLYRGVCNICEAKQIILNQTAGGLAAFPQAGGIRVCDRAQDVNFPKFGELVPEDATAYMRNQRTHGEGRPGIVNNTNLRPLIEYTTNENVASNFGVLGYFEIHVDSCYLEPNAGGGNERSIFCVSSACVEFLQFTPNRLSRTLSGQDLENLNLFINFLREKNIERLPYVWKRQ